MCVSCGIYVHDICVQDLNREFACRQSFRQNVRKYREHHDIPHHWVYKKNNKVRGGWSFFKTRVFLVSQCFKYVQGRCKPCNGSVASGYQCSWCKRSYHNHKDSCKKAMESDTKCDLGEHFKVTKLGVFLGEVHRHMRHEEEQKNPFFCCSHVTVA